MSFRPSLLVAAGLLVVGCGGGDPSMPGSTQPLPQTTGSFAGTYTVPTTPALAAAATFAVDRVDWTVTGGVARLDYDLPEGLVGGKLSLELAGPLAPGATSVSLSSALGTATCTATGTVITCHEILGDLGTLPISLAVVQADALTQYPGPVSDRVTVATVFSSDPIGNVSFDLATPSPAGGTGPSSP